MSLKGSLLRFCAALLLVALLIVCLAPFAVAGGLRIWIGRLAKQQGLQVEIGKIEAPLLRPVVLHNVRVTTAHDALFRVLIDAPRVEADLHLAALFDHSRARAIRSLTAEGIRADIRRTLQPGLSARVVDWRSFGNWLADSFKLSALQLYVENGPTTIDLRDCALSAAETESGVFTAREARVTLPWFQKNFSQLRGATSWQESRLTLGALTLIKGLDLDAITVDLSDLEAGRMGLEISVDAFGGKVRAHIGSQDHGDQRTWDVVATATEVSLAQMSDALDLTDRASGALHACKFTFRGEATNVANATASIWAEITGLTWRDRSADTLMLGASLYNRQVQIEQVYVKQRNNQLTVSGESSLPHKPSDWLNPDFRGDISASITDLGEFARLFGGNPSDFGGQVIAQGSVSAREHKLAGQLEITGKSLVLFKSLIEGLNARLTINESRLEIDRFDLERGADFLRTRGNIDLTGEHAYSATITGSVADLANYAGWLSQSWPALSGGSVSVEWAGTGGNDLHSGTFQARGHNLQLRESTIVPFDAELEGEYSPDNIFFRQFRLSNGHAAFNAFVTVAKEYLQLQTLRLDLEGKPKLQGNVFLPVSLSKVREGGDWWAAIGPDPNFDVDVTLDPIDLAELARAVTKGARLSGKVAGRIELYGAAASLESQSQIHLRECIWGSESPLSADLETNLSLGSAILKIAGNIDRSGPIKIDAVIPLRLEKRDQTYALGTDGPVTAKIDFPAILLATLPHYLVGENLRDGILSGQLTISNSIRRPRIIGDAQLIDGKFARDLAGSARVTFRDQLATIDFLNLTQNNVSQNAGGEIDFRDLSSVVIKVVSVPRMVEWSANMPGDCIRQITLFSGTGDPAFVPHVDEVAFRGGAFATGWTISLTNNHTPAGSSIPNEASPPRTFSFCRDGGANGKNLLLGPAP